MKLLSAAASLVFAACSPQAPRPAEPAPPAQPQAAAPSEPLDPFVVMIDAERWGVIIDKAMEGAREATPPTVDPGDLYRADAALKNGAASLIELRNEVCGQGLLTGVACDLKDWPEWTREPPSDKTPIEEIDRRSRWLGEVMGPFAEAGCEAGRKATGEDLFCSVE
jgi:hypothetical protein